MALVRWNDLLATVAEALSGWGQPVPWGDPQGRELRDFSMDFQVDTVEGLTDQFPDAQVADALESQLPGLLDRFQSDPHSRAGVVTIPTAPNGEPPQLLTIGFAQRSGVLDMTLVFRESRFPEDFEAWVGPALHLQERMAGLLDLERGRISWFAMILYGSGS